MMKTYPSLILEWGPMISALTDARGFLLEIDTPGASFWLDKLDSLIFELHQSQAPTHKPSLWFVQRHNPLQRIAVSVHLKMSALNIRTKFDHCVENRVTLFLCGWVITFIPAKGLWLIPHGPPVFLAFVILVLQDNCTLRVPNLVPSHHWRSVRSR